jgi:ATP-dependent Lon protease
LDIIKYKIQKEYIDTEDKIIDKDSNFIDTEDKVIDKDNNFIDIEDKVINKDNNFGIEEYELYEMIDNQEIISEKGFILDNFKNNDSDDIVKKIIDNNIIPSENKINECIKQLNHFKKIHNEITDNNILNEKNINTMINKINDLECMLNLNLLINQNSNYHENNNLGCTMNLSKRSGDKELFSEERSSKENISSNSSVMDEIEDNEYNLKFKNYITKVFDDISIFIKEWNDFKDKKKNYMENVDNILNKCTYGQLDAKKQMKRIIGQWMNGNSKGQCFGLCGPPGVGKTTLCKNGLAKCLFDENGESRPFAFLPLGGATNGSILEGHHYTYLGSTWGKIVDILMETKCMNPIIYIDELDKISKTEHGKEIASILTHITDQSQNKEFYDKYFTSIPIDLSQVLFIFSYNNKDDIDSILRDRIQEIPVRALSLQDKLIISQNYVIPEILSNVGFSNMEVIFTNEILSKIINQYTHEAGVRKLNEILYDIVRDINLKKIENNNQILEYPIKIDDKITEPVLSTIDSVNIKMINNKPLIGQGTGLYAYSSGAIGGITVIQVMKTISDKKLSIEKLTGCLGDVMKESMNCSLTVAWNILPLNIKKEIQESKEGCGLHIHCGNYQQKDGPSASIIQCISIISRLVNVAIRNDVAMTGEMDLQGNALEIGGLYSKIMGAYNAGVKKVLIPKDNEKDLDLIFKREKEEMFEIKKIKSILNNSLIRNIPSYSNIYEYDMKTRLFKNTMEIIIINDVFEALEHTLVPNNLIFNRDF